MSDIVEAVKYQFISSLCGLNFNLEPHGYFSKCQTNLYLLTIPQLVLLLFTVPGLTNQVEGGKKRTLLKQIKFAFASLHVVITTLYGNDVLNPLSTTVSLAWLFVAFLSAFLELNGFLVPRKSLLGYYFVCCLGYGYFVTSQVAKGVDLANNPQIAAGVFVFLTSFANACLRDIGDAVEQNEH